MNQLLILILSILGLSCADATQAGDIRARIEAKLKDALTRFEPTNNAFIFTVYHKDTAIVQVVHRSYVGHTRQPNDEFGLAVNVTFDPTFPDEIANLKKFKELTISNLFVSYDWDGIPCYVLDLDKDVTGAAEVLTTLLTDLYGYDLKANLKYELLDQGRLK